MPREEFYGVVGLNPVGGYSGENIVESARVENMEVRYNFMYQATSPFSIDISYRFLAPAGGGVSITAFSFTVAMLRQKVRVFHMKNQQQAAQVRPIHCSCQLRPCAV